MPRPDEPDDLGFQTKMQASVGRLALLPQGERATALHAEVNLYPATQHGFVRPYLSMAVQKLSSETLQPTMKPREYFSIIAISITLIVVLFGVTLILKHFTELGFKEALALTALGLFLMGFLAISLAIPNPTASQQRAFNVYLALAAAGAGSGLPGFLNLDAKFNDASVTAGGALALFALVLWWKPAGKPVENS